MTSGMFLLHHLSNLATHRHFTIGSKLGNTNTLKCCPCREASGIKGKWMAHFIEERSLLPGDSLELGPLHSLLTVSRPVLQLSLTSGNHVTSSFDSTASALSFCVPLATWSSHLFAEAQTILWRYWTLALNILSYFCFFNINLFTYGAKKCSGVYALGPWDI